LATPTATSTTRSTTRSTLGPALAATLVTPDFNGTVRAWCEFLRQRIQAHDHLSLKHARQWGVSELAGAPMCWLVNELGERWLRIIGLPDAEVVDPFAHKGWMSLEISVQDVDSLYPVLKDSPFRIIGEPANLDVSDDIRAMQVIGPAGEVLYLTEVKAEVPPFELPFARCAVDRLFIPVMLADDREAALGVYESFPGTEGLRFDTKITVINRARGLDIETKHPVSTIQLRGKNLIEIDQLDDLSERPLQHGLLPAGIAMITFGMDRFPAELEDRLVSRADPATVNAGLVRGAGGELIELIELQTQPE
jgi:hypothetical protein